ncbi:MAG: hypothetical protein JWR26_2487 [Pedosphaera sp.]|nr:hypothetical protein [Pedosphaera sp.]
MNASTQTPKPLCGLQPSPDTSQTRKKSTTARKLSLSARLVLLLAGIALLLFGSPAARAHESPAGCSGSGLGISLFTSIPDVHVGDTISYSVLVFNTPFPACDATEIVASITTPDGITNNVTLLRTSLQPGQSDYYANVVSYVVRAQDIQPDGTVRAKANDQGNIHQNDTDSRGGGNQGVNTEVNMPCIKLLVQCSGIVAPNGALTFTGTVTNCGNNTLVGVTVSNFVDGQAFTVFFQTNLAIGQSANFNGSWIPANPCNPSTATLVAIAVDQFTSTPRTVTSSASATCSGILTPGIHLTKVCPASPTPVGQLLVYSGSVSNTGNVILTNIVVVDNQPVANTTVFTLASLAPGAVANFTGSYVVPGGACSVSDILTASATSACGVAVSSTANATCPIVTTPKVAVSLSCPLGPIVSGSLVTYTGTVLNSGDVTLNNVTVAAPQASPAALGLVGYWAFDEASGGFAVDGSGSGNAGNIINATRVVGQTGGALSFNGSSSWVDITNKPSLNFTGPITLAAWIKPSSSGGIQNILVHGYTGSTEVFLRINGGNYEVGAWNGSTTPTATFGVPAGDIGNWVHVAGVYNGSTWILYRNGVSVKTNSAGIGPMTMAADWAVGARAGGTERFFSGSIDEVRMYNRELTSVEIAALTSPVLFTAATLAPGASGNFSIVARAGACSATASVVAVGTGNCNGVAVTNATTATCIVTTAPALAVTLVCPAVSATAGGPITYTGTVRNSGNITLNNVTVVNNQPAPNTVLLTLTNLVPGATANFSATFTTPADSCSVSSTVIASGFDNCSNAQVSTNASATCTLVSTPGLVVTQVCPVNPPVSGSPLTFSGTVRNSGNITLTNVSVVNNLSGATPIFTAASLAPGATANFTGSYVAPTNCASTSTSTVTAQSVCGVSVSNSATTTCTVQTSSGIAVTETCPVTPMAAGGLLTYSGTVRNLGNIALTNVTVVSDRPVANTTVFTLGTLAPGAVATFNGSYTVPTNVCSVTANLKASGGDTCSGLAVTNGASATCIVATAPALVVTVACPAVSATAGGPITYTGTVRNSGNVTLNNVVVVNNQPAPNTVVFTVPSLAPGVTANFSATFTTPVNACSVSTMVTASGNDNCSNALVSNSASANCALGSTPSIVITQICPANPTAPGTLLVYTGTVSNSGNISLTNISVVNNLSGPSAIFTVASLAPGVTVNFSGSYVAPTNCSSTSTSTVTAQSSCGVSVVNSATTTCTILTSSSIQLTEVCPVTPVTPGSVVTFTGTVRNPGLITLTNVLVVSDRPVANTTVFTAATLAPGVTANFTGSYTVPTNACSVTANLRVTAGDSCSGLTVTNGASATCTVVTAPALVVSVACPAVSATAGGSITYTGTVRNSGNVTLNNVIVVNNQPVPNTVVLTVPSLAPGVTANFTATFTTPVNACSVSTTVTASGNDNCSNALVSNSATANCTLGSTPSIVITQVCPANPTVPGTPLVFTGTVSNSGNIALTNISVVNNLSGATPVFTAASLAPGVTVNFSGSYVAPTNCSSTSTSTATAQSVCGVSVVNSATTTCTILTSSSIQLTEACPVTPVTPGSVVTFTGTVRNPGLITLTNVLVVSDRPAANTTVFTAATLAPGITANFTGSYTVPANACSVTANLRVTGGDSCSGLTVTNGASATCAVVTAPALVVSVACPAVSATVGGPITYTGTVRNSGNVTLNNVIVVNNQPAPNTVVLTVPTLAPGVTANFTATFTTPVDSCSVSTTVTASGNDSCTTNLVSNTASATCNLITTPSIVVTQTCPAAPAAPGMPLTYTGTVHNGGNITLTNIIVLNNLSGATPVYTLASLAPGATVNFTGSYVAPTNCSSTSTATATAQSICGVSVVNSATTTCTLLATPDIEVSQTCPATLVVPGGVITFAGTVSNPGSSTLTNVIVYNNRSGATPIFTLATLAAGASANFSGSYVSHLDCCVDSSTVTASGQGCNGTTVTDTDTATCTLLIQPKIVVTKFCPTGVLQPGDLLTYSGTVSNAGNIVLVNVIVVDSSPTNNTPLQGPIVLAPGETVTYTASYVLPADFCGNDTVTASGFDLCTSASVSDSKSTSCPILTTPRIAISKTCPPSPTLPGALLVYTGMITNTGNVTLVNVTVVDNQPTNGTPVIGPITLAPGATAFFTGSYIVSGCCCEIIDTVTVRGQDRCTSNQVSATASQACPLMTMPALTVTEVCPTTPTPVGGVLVFSGSVSNSGNVNLTNVFVFSALPGSNTPVLGPIELAPGESETFTGSYIVANVTNVMTNASTSFTTNPAARGFSTLNPVSHTVSNRFTIPANMNGLVFASSDEGYAATQFYSMRKDVSGTSFFDTLTAGTSAVTDRFAASTRNFDSLAFAGPDVGYGPVIFYYLSHDLNGQSSFGTITPGGVVGVVSDKFVLGNNFDSLTFSATDVGYGANMFYYVRHNAAGVSTFGTINPALPGTVTDRFTVGTNIDALVFTATDVGAGYGANNFYYLRHDSAGVATFGTIFVTGLNTATVTDRYVVGTNATELAFAASDTGFGANLFYILRGAGTTVSTVSTNVGPGIATVLASGVGICQARTVIATGSCPGVVPAASYNKSSVDNTGTFRLPFATQIGMTYTVQYKNAMTDLTWTNLPNMPIAGTGQVITVTDSTGTQPMRFYRVTVGQ